MIKWQIFPKTISYRQTNKLLLIDDIKYLIDIFSYFPWKNHGSMNKEELTYPQSGEASIVEISAWTNFHQENWIEIFFLFKCAIHTKFRSWLKDKYPFIFTDGNLFRRLSGPLVPLYCGYINNVPVNFTEKDYNCARANFHQ